MTYISADSFRRSSAFEACVGQLDRDLKTDAVRNALDEQATRDFLDITTRLEPASVKHAVISIGRRARQDGKVALAFLTEMKRAHFM